MRTARLMSFLLLLVVAVVLSGCPQTQRAEVATRENAGQSVQEVQVGLGEWYVNLDPATIRPGAIRFNIRNEGQRLHALEIENGNVEERSTNLEPGQSGTMTATLPAGEYKAYCPIGNHEAQGMTTTLTVRE